RGRLRRLLAAEARGDAGDDRRGERRPAAEVRARPAVLVLRCNRGAEYPFARREDLQAATAGAGPPAVVRRHPADGNDAVDGASEDRGEAVDEPVAAAAVVDVVAGHDEEKLLAARVGVALRVDAADHLADLL